MIRDKARYSEGFEEDKSLHRAEGAFEMIKCKDCRFGGLKVLLDNESAPCLRLDDEECPNYNEETGEIEMLREGKNK